MRKGCDRLYQFGLTSTLALLGCIIGENALAQITPDETLGNERSVVRQGVQVRGELGDRIEGGAQRGVNLFHSFQEFNIGDGQRVYFGNPDGIANILSRVTGGNPSNILGTLGVDGAANLFFLNPNGILFGPNASLDVNGSFVATTADAIGFGEQGFFSATNPEVPSSLLTVNPSAFFFNQVANQPTNSIESRASLTVPEGHSLLFVGGRVFPDATSTGNILIREGRLRAGGGRIELGGLAAPGTIQLNTIGNTMALGFPSDVPRVDVTLIGEVAGFAELDVTSGGGGDVVIHAGNVNILDGSDVCAGIGATPRCGGEAIDFGAAGRQAGDITLNAQGILTIAGSGSIVENTVNSEAIGNSGNINIKANSVMLSGSSGIYANVDRGGNGNSGGVDITTNSLCVMNRAQVGALTEGIGDAGNIRINAQDQVFLLNSIIISEVVEGGGIGQGGNIDITTGILELRDGSALLADTEYRGDAGNITITASDAVILAGKGRGANNPDEIVPSQITSMVANSEISRGEGEGGDITITTGQLLVDNEGFISASTFGQGSAGEIRIGTDSLSLRGGAQVIASTFSEGNAGRVTIDVSDEISISGRGENDAPPSGIFSTVEETGTGDSGGVEITTGELLITERGQIGSYTGNRGNAGDISITARDRVYLVNSAIISEVEETGNGNGGNVNLTTDVLELRDGSLILADTENIGDAGDVSITANDRIVLVGQGPNAFQNSDQTIPSQISSSVDYSGTAVGEGGDISITTESLSITDEGFIRSATFGQGSAGDISIDADTIQLSDSSAISSAIRRRGVGDGGDIEIQSRSILLRGGSQINALVGRQQRDEQGNVISGGRGRGGDLRITASDSITLSGTDENGFSSGFLTLTERGASGRAGNIHITTGDLRIANGAIVVASTYNSSHGGDIFINANDLEAIGGGQIVTSTRSSGNAGLIQLDIADRIVLSGFDPNFADRREQVREYIPTTNGQFEQSSDIINNEGANSGIFANTTSRSSGAGGTIIVEANSLNLRNRAEISAATSGIGQGGNIEIETDSLNLDDRARITASTAGQRRAGNITITAADLNLADGSSVLAESTGTGEAGDITVNVGELLNMTDSEIRTSAAQSSGGAITVNSENADVRLFGTSDITTSVDTGVGDGGSIAVTANTIQLHDDSDIRTSVAGGQGDGGNITLRASSIVAFDDSDIIAATPEGQGGDITFDTNAFFAEDFDADAANANPDDLEDNDRADVNATGTQPGTITTPDTSFIQNSLTDLPESAIDPDNLVANSCVVRSQEQGGTFVITGAEGLPQRPGDATFPTYPTGEVRSVPDAADSENQQSWQMGDPIVEPQGVYQLSNGQLVLSRECPEEGR